jgi:hypothetical protein
VSRQEDDRQKECMKRPPMEAIRFCHADPSNYRAGVKRVNLEGHLFSYLTLDHLVPERGDEIESCLYHWSAKSGKYSIIDYGHQ